MTALGTAFLAGSRVFHVFHGVGEEYPGLRRPGTFGIWLFSVRQPELLASRCRTQPPWPHGKGVIMDIRSARGKDCRGQHLLFRRRAREADLSRQGPSPRQLA